MPATAAAVLRELERLGTAQNATIYRRQGAGENVYGVASGELRPLAKRLGTDHDLALALWDSGYADARCLATMVADPASMTREEADAWVEGMDHYLHGAVEVDHGETGCRTPVAGPYIERALARKKKTAATA